MKKDKNIEVNEEVVEDNTCCCEECNCEDDCSNDQECECNGDKREVEEIDYVEIIKELETKVLYNQAELINYRKRKDEEVSNMLRYANQDIIMELIPILDNFERAMNIKQSDEEVKQYLSGIKMIYNHFVDTLKKFGVEEIPALGLVFNPNYHEAITTACDMEKEDDLVLEVLIKGYKLKDRVIRHAVVKVNKLED